MKKMFWMLGVAVAALTSCTNDEVVEVNQSNLIKFESFVNKGTRAVTEETETTTARLSQFYVFGGYGANYTNVFDNVAFVKDGSTTEWKPSDTKNEAEWTANTYYFAAYANKNSSDQFTATTNVSFDANGLKFINYVVSDNEDLVAALSGEVDNTDLGNKAVALTFKHMLSQVKFTFKNTDASHTMSVSNISVSNVNNKGTGTLTDSGISWTDLSVDNNYALSYAGTTEKVAAKGYYDPDYQMVIPQNLNTSSKEIKITFTITFYDNNDAVVSTETFSNVSLVYDNDKTEGEDNKNFTAWEPGYKYNYTANFPADPKTIRFTVTKVEDWENQTAIGDNGTPGDNKMDF